MENQHRQIKGYRELNEAEIAAMNEINRRIWVQTPEPTPTHRAAKHRGESMQVLFSINEYDKDGDVIEPGIFLHFGWTRVKVASNMAEFRRVVESISNMPAEIQENYPDVPQGQ